MNPDGVATQLAMIERVLAKCTCRGSIDVKSMKLVVANAVEVAELNSTPQYVLDIHARVIDSYNPTGWQRFDLVIRSHVPLYGFRHEGDVLSWLQHQLKKLFFHELCEQFEYDGVKVWDPHR